MQSELHERLDYLINFSSQLIFVSGDSIAEQQRTLEAFVYQQKDDTELAFFSANQNLSISDYRRQLCRQLLGETVGSFVRPLNELLSGLNQHNGPVLITITQSEHMPDALLQELWELVLQSRFAGNKQHLNVLLFGETSWAERAKKWLPAKNTDTPLLIRSQSVAREQYTSEIDKLLADRRIAFQNHLQKRERSQLMLSNSTLSKPWFLPAIGGVFLITFALLIAHFYGDNIKTLFKPLHEEELPSKSLVTLPDVQPTEPKTYVVEAVESVKLQEVLEPQNNEEQLADSWTSAIEKLDSTTSETKQPPSLSAVEENTSDTSVASQKTEEPSIFDKAENIDNAPPVSGSKSLVASEISVAQTKTRVTSNNDALRAQLSPDQFWIQLAGLKSSNLLNDFIVDNNLTEQTIVYKTQRYGGDWFVVLWHTSYFSVEEANDQIKTLPNYNGLDNAFVKASLQILRELDRNDASTN